MVTESDSMSTLVPYRCCIKMLSWSFFERFKFFLNDCYHGPAEEFVLDSVNIVCILASVNIVY